MKFNLPIWGIALIVVGAIVIGYLASMQMAKMKAAKDSTEKEPNFLNVEKEPEGSTALKAA